MENSKKVMRLAIAAFVILAGCSSSTSENSTEDAQVVAEADPGADNTTTETSAVEAEEIAESDELLDAAAPEFLPDATLLDSSVAPLDAGTYRIDSLSIPFSLTLPNDGFVERNADGKFIVTTSINTGRADDGLQFIRAARLPDPIDTLAYFEAIDEGWDPQDFAGWLDAMPSTITISNRIETTVGGFPAIRFDATQLPPPTCTFGVICGTFGSAGPWSAAIMTEGAQYRVWFVDLGETDPVVIAAGISNEQSVWFDTAEQIVNTIGFGEVQPNAIRIVDEGSIDLDVFDGIRVSSAESFWVNESSGQQPEIAGIDWTFGVVDFLTRPNDQSGSPIASSDELVAYLEDQGIIATELEATVIDGIDARVFDVGATDFDPILSQTEDSEATYAPTVRSHWWVIEHPERGLLIMSASFFDPSFVGFDRVTEWTAQIAQTIEFIG